MASTNVLDSQSATKICCVCKVDKPLSQYNVRRERNNAPRAYCRECNNSKVKTLRSADPNHKARERERSTNRRDYINAHQQANKEKRNQRANALNQIKRESTPPSCRVYFIVCELTGVLFTAKTNGAKYSEEGYRIKARQDAKERDRLAHVPETIACKHCSKSFTTEYADKRTTFCSPKCSRLHITRITKTYRRRAKHHGVAYEPIDVLKVFKRDKWTCNFCGIKTPQSKRGTIEPDAPELDHIIPMSKGGDHLLYNVQCLCRKCNHEKGNKLIGQLMLTV